MSNRADAEAEKSVKRALIDERARWILQEVTAEFLMIAAEAILTETAISPFGRIRERFRQFRNAWLV